jgi:hypothetical protein
VGESAFGAIGSDDGPRGRFDRNPSVAALRPRPEGGHVARGEFVDPAGSSTNPSVPTRPAKSPDECPRRGGRQQLGPGPLESRTGRRQASFGLNDDRLGERRRGAGAGGARSHGRAPEGRTGGGRCRPRPGCRAARRPGVSRPLSPNQKGLPGRCATPWKILLHALPAELGGQEVELALGHAARDQHDVVLGEDVPEHVLDLVADVAQVEPVGPRVARLMSAARIAWSLLRRIWCGATSASTSTSSSPVETRRPSGNG